MVTAATTPSDAQARPCLLDRAGCSNRRVIELRAHNNTNRPVDLIQAAERAANRRLAEKVGPESSPTVTGSPKPHQPGTRPSASHGQPALRLAHPGDVDPQEDQIGTLFSDGPKYHQKRHNSCDHGVKVWAVALRWVTR